MGLYGYLGTLLAVRGKKRGRKGPASFWYRKVLLSNFFKFSVIIFLFQTEVEQFLEVKFVTDQDDVILAAR